MDEDIEILDLSNNKKEVNKVVVNEKPKKLKRKPKKIVRIIELVFCLVSALFILGCCVYYGSRFIKYYRIYNPKIEKGDGSVLLANDISGNSEIVYEGNGLYISAGNYIYKGDVGNNYVSFNNMLWRIIQINKDNTIDLILDDYINIFSWNNEATAFKNSDVFKYLNDNFLNNLDKDMLVKNSFCTDKITDLTSITCNEQDMDSYVKLLDITSFLNSIKGSKTYLTKSDEIFWLNNYSDDKVWHVNGINASLSDSTNFYEIRPVIKLKSSIYYKKGDGTKNNPYIIETDNKLSLGSKVKLGEDTWIVYDTSDNIKLMKSEVLEEAYAFDNSKYTFDKDSKDSLAEYLNTTYLDSLSYKDMLMDNEWYIGEFKSQYQDIKDTKIKVKVAIPNMLDIKLDSEIKGYFTSTCNKESILVYENPLRVSRPTTKRNIRPVIAISKSSASKLEYQDGIFEVK